MTFLSAALSVLVEFGNARNSTLKFKKVDSLLRGNSVSELAIMATNLRYFLALSHRQEGRIVRDGILYRKRAESYFQSLDVLDLRKALEPLKVTIIQLEMVHSGVEHLAATIRAVASRGDVPVVDAVNEADLDTIA